MPSKPPSLFAAEQALLAELGQRLRLARKRRKLSMAALAQRAGVSRTSICNAEAGDAGATLGTYLRILAALGLQEDLGRVALDDPLGRRLQDQALASARCGHDARGGVELAALIKKRMRKLEDNVAAGEREPGALFTFPRPMVEASTVTFPKDAFGSPQPW